MSKGGDEGYLGALGRTREVRVQFRFPSGELKPVSVFRVVNAATDPSLAKRALETDPGRALNRVSIGGGRSVVAQVAFAYHDPKRRLLVLVLPESARHRELEERAAWLEELRGELEHPIPNYFSNATCVYGPIGLEAWLEERSRAAPEVLEEREAELAARERALAAKEEEFTQSGRATTDSDMFENTRPGDDDVDTGLYHRLDFEAQNETRLEIKAVDSPMRRKRRTAPLGHDTSALGPRDVQFERWVASQELTLKSLEPDGSVRLAATASQRQRNAILSPDTQIRLCCHFMPTYPLVVLLVGPLSEEREPTHLVFSFDMQKDSDRKLLMAWTRTFSFTLELFDLDYVPLATRQVEANLEDNVVRALQLGDAYLAELGPDKQSFQQALVAFANAGHARASSHDGNVSVEAVTHLVSPSAVWEALEMVRTLSTVGSERYLLARGYPMARWRAQRRDTMRKVVEHGYWPGDELVQLALEEGLAPDRQALTDDLVENFQKLLAGDHGLTEQQIEENWSHLRPRMQEPRAAKGTRTFAIDSDSRTVVSGEINTTRMRRRPDRDTWVERYLDDPKFSATVALTKTQKPDVLPDVFEALYLMSEAQAGITLAEVLSYGSAAVPHLLVGLDAERSHVRMGCALALGLISDRRGVGPLCDLLAAEQSDDAWHEVARGIGEYGAVALTPLLSLLSNGHSLSEERVAWALAFVALREGPSVLSGLRGSAAKRVGKRAAMLLPDAEDENRTLIGASSQVRNDNPISSLLLARRHGLGGPATVEADAGSGPEHRV